MTNIIYHIDKTLISLFGIRLEGWAVSSDGNEVDILSKENVKYERVKRLDVNKCHDIITEDICCGFSITIHSWKKVIIQFSEADSIVDLEIDCWSYKKQYISDTLHKMVKKVKEIGMLNTIRLIWKKIKKTSVTAESSNYMEWRTLHNLSSNELAKQRNQKFAYNPLISIVVPTYNTPSNFLVEMIESVIAQTYENWELCIADGASTDKKVLSILKKYEEGYENIKVKYLVENKMISKNTNEAISLANGEFIGLFDHDDLLAPNALFECVKMLNDDNKLDMIYSDEDKVDYKGSTFFEPHFKPDFSKYTLLSYNYITHFTVIRKKVLDKVGLFDSNCDGAQDYDMFLRICDVTENIGHISKVLYHWRVHDNSTAASASAKTYVTDAGKHSLNKHLLREGVKGEVVDGLFPTSYKINYKILDNPKVSIVIPNKDHIKDLKMCIDTVLEKTTYMNYEIIIVENNSIEDETFQFYEAIIKNDKIKVVYWKSEFNYSEINNFGVTFATGSHILLLNNDVAIINENWLNEMLMLSQFDEVGCVGAKLYYEDGSIQHAGIILGIGSVAGHSHKYYPHDSFGYVGRLKVTQNVSAVTAACLMIKKKIFDEVNGLNAAYKVAFNDVDFCLRIAELGYKNVFTPYSELFHYESKSRGLEDTDEKIQRFNGEIKQFENNWGLWKIDPYYNENLSITKEDFSLK